ncbi:MAG: 16S rRNA processing protein RimM [Gammaproteobacteria bacterium]|jgi:16S rRNA processing protein RimM
MVDVALTQPLVVGRISGVYGIKGWVKLFSHTEPAENVLSYKNLWIETGNHWKQLEIANRKPHGLGFVIKVDGFDDRDKARELVARDIAIDRNELPSLDHSEDGYYWTDLVGLNVVNTEAATLGVVKSMMETGANDVLVLKCPKGDECLVPFVTGEIIKSVDLKSSLITVDWPADF